MKPIVKSLWLQYNTQASLFIMIRSSDENVHPNDLFQEKIYPHPTLFPGFNEEESCISKLEIAQHEVKILLNKEAKLSAKVEFLERVLDDTANQKKLWQVKFNYSQAQILAGEENDSIALRCTAQSKCVLHKPPKENRLKRLWPSTGGVSRIYSHSRRSSGDSTSINSAPTTQLGRTVYATTRKNACSRKVKRQVDTPATKG